MLTRIKSEVIPKVGPSTPEVNGLKLDVTDRQIAGILEEALCLLKKIDMYLGIITGENLDNDDCE